MNSSDFFSPGNVRSQNFVVYIHLLSHVVRIENSKQTTKKLTEKWTIPMKKIRMVSIKMSRPLICSPETGSRFLKNVLESCTLL